MASKRQKSTQHLEQQALLNRTAVAISKLQNLPFLPKLETQSADPNGASTGAASFSDAQNAKKEIESLALFNRSERLGVGAKPSALPTSNGSDEFEALRRRLLGRRGMRQERELLRSQAGAKAKNVRATGGAGLKRRREEDESSSDEEEGRAAMLGSKKTRHVLDPAPASEQGEQAHKREAKASGDGDEAQSGHASEDNKPEVAEDGETHVITHAAETPAQHASNNVAMDLKNGAANYYLDEVLAERKRKREKKKKKKKKRKKLDDEEPQGLA